MLQTRITKLFGIEYPIILGGLQLLGRAGLAAAVSSAGGLGLVTAGCFSGAEDFLNELSLARSLTDKPVGVNISLGIRRGMDEFLDAALVAQVPVVFTSGRNPEKYVARLKQAGIKLVHVVPAVRYALKAQEIGADAVVVVGFEAGGHPGMDDVANLALIPQACDALEIPVIAAGGIADGRGLVAALALGAEGVQLGSRFVATVECVAHDNVKQAYLKAAETDTVLVEKSLKNALRVLRTETAGRVLDLEAGGGVVGDLLPYIGGDAYARVVGGGDLAAGVLSCGQGVGLIREILPAGEVIQRMVAETRAVLGRLNGILS
ncbi:MAG TPA: nitronate monooxygenase [Spirochaetia bacterium]|nr:nitronate monooxygenase [Spirochaetia bacterium]